MTDTEITPELLRAVAEWTENRHTIGSMTISRVLRKEAHGLEREHAYEKRIDQLAKVFHDASTGRVDPGRSTWDLLTPLSHEQCRAGIRAVLSCLEEDRSADAASESCTKPETAQVSPHAREPRMWGDLREVPPGVHTVVDKDGDRYLRDPWAKNRWSVERSYAPIDEYMSFEHAPFTEVIADA